MIGRFGPLSVLFATLVAGSLRPAWAAAPTDACTMLTPAQVSAILGVQVGAGSGLVQHVCSWYASGTQKGATLIIYSPKRFDVIKQSMAGYGPAKTSLGGVGDEALFGEIRDIAGTVLVKKGDFVYMVRVEGFPFEKNGSVPRKVEAMEKALAEMVLSKL